jgi:dipeptidyl aminopeptidase/acylaminoacyl peptidase
MKKLLVLLLSVLISTTCLAGEIFTAEALYSHPMIVGTPPANPTWSPDGKKLAFLWNEDGNRFENLYLLDASGKIARLTDLKEMPRNENICDTRSDVERLDEITLDGGLSSLFWSRDGKKIYFTFRGDLFNISTKKGSQPTRIFQTAVGESNFSISDDGKWIAYTSGNNIFVTETSTGQIVQLTRDGSDDIRNATGAYDTYLSGVFWAPDSRKIAFVQHDITGFQRFVIPDYTPAKVEANEQQREIAGGRLPAIKLGIVNPNSAHKQPMWMDLPADEQYYLRSIDWSPDSKQILFEVMRRDMLTRYILIGDAETGKVDTIWQESDNKWIPRNMARVRFGPEGKDAIFGSEMSGWCHLHSIPIEGSSGISRALTSGEWEIPSGGWGARNDWRLSKDRSTLIFISSLDDPAERHLYRINLPRGGQQRITPDKGWIRQISITEDGSKAAVIYGDLDHSYDLYICDTKSEKPMQRITWSQPDDFHDYDWFKPEYIKVPTSDGHEVPAKLWLPTNGVTPAPLIVYIHGAGYHQNVEKSAWGYEDRFHRMLAQQGFAVIDIDYRGSSGYGRDWRVAIYRHTGGKDLDDAVDAANYCIEQGWGIPGKVGIWGWSYGGFMTNMAMFKRPDIFKVGCSVAAVNDWKNYNLEYTSQRFKDPDDDPEAYAQSSPIEFADGLEGKLLLIHGLQDDNVHVQDTIQLIDKLIRLNKDFDLLLYPRERHGFSRDESDIHVMRSIMNYFEEHLK